MTFPDLIAVILILMLILYVKDILVLNFREWRNKDEK